MHKEIQSDQRPKFTSGIFQELRHYLDIKRVVASVYRPQSQGAFERLCDHTFCCCIIFVKLEYICVIVVLFTKFWYVL